MAYSLELYQEAFQIALFISLNKLKNNPLVSDVTEDLVKWYVTFKITTLSMLLSFLHLILRYKVYICIYISTINNLSCGQTTVKNLRHSISTNDFFNVESCDATLNGKNSSVKLVFCL